MARAKVCGLTSAEDLSLAVGAGADATGVITDVPVDTPREVAPGTAADLLAAVPPFVTGVLVTMPETAAAAAPLAEEAGADAVQVHGSFGSAELRELRAATDAAVLPVVAAGDAERAREIAPAADALVVDTPSADGGGGTGETHDWAATGRLVADLDVPVVLAGGLTPENVAEAVETADPFAVDAASGVESAGGKKDPEAVRAFVRGAGAAR
jgi:phosphoribosylanthranilate isomerase